MQTLLLALVLILSSKLSFAECQEALITAKQTVTPYQQIWETEDSELLWAPSTLSQVAYLDFLRAVRGTIKQTGPYKIIETQLPLFLEDIRPAMKAEGYNSALVLKKQAGHVRRISCLESLLIQEQTSLFPLAEFPYEFLASIFKKEAHGKHRIRIVLRLGAAPFQRPIKEDIAVSAAEGWTFWAHIHNHPFELNKYPYQIFQGLTAPSLSDVQIFRNWAKEYGLKNALITNGFDTLQIPAADFDVFCSWDDEDRPCFHQI